MKETLNQIAEKIRKNFEACDKGRERAFFLHREIIKRSSQAIRAVHRGEYPEGQKLVDEAKSLLMEATQSVAQFPRVAFAGFLEDAQKEYVEAWLTLTVIAYQTVPNPDEVGVEYSAFLNGLAETVGELRRHILDLIRQGQAEKGEQFLQYMDEIFYVLTGLDFPDMITNGLRRRTDIARSIIEKTRGDLTACLSQNQLLKEMKKIGG